MAGIRPGPVAYAAAVETNRPGTLAGASCASAAVRPVADSAMPRRRNRSARARRARASRLESVPSEIPNRAAASCRDAPSSSHTTTGTRADPGVPIGGHVTRPGVRLLPPTGGAAPALVFRRDPADMPPGTGTYDFLPRCDRPEVRREPVSDAGAPPPFDVLFYAPDDPDQVRRKDSYPGQVAPYLDTAAVNPFAPPSVVQSFARMVRVRCLPTRFRLVPDGRGTAAEYREGIRAWDAPGATGGR